MHPSYPSQFIDCICTINERFAPTAYHATLPNGKRIVAFVQKREKALIPLIKPGDKVLCTICPADFDRARIRSLAGSPGESL